MLQVTTFRFVKITLKLLVSVQNIVGGADKFHFTVGEDGYNSGGYSLRSSQSYQLVLRWIGAPAIRGWRACWACARPMEETGMPVAGDGICILKSEFEFELSGSGSGFWVAVGIRNSATRSECDK